MIVWSLFIISHMGLFVYTQKGSIISMLDLPTTEIIEPEKLTLERTRFVLSLSCPKGLKHSPEERMDARNALLNKFKEVFGLFLLKMEKEQLV